MNQDADRTGTRAPTAQAARHPAGRNAPSLGPPLPPDATAGRLGGPGRALLLSPFLLLSPSGPLSPGGAGEGRGEGSMASLPPLPISPSQPQSGARR